jgi:hypothetical protein
MSQSAFTYLRTAVAPIHEAKQEKNYEMQKF